MRNALLTASVGTVMSSEGVAVMGRKPRTFDAELSAKIEKLVWAYQAGDEEAGLELLCLYGGDPKNGQMSNFLGKYYKMFRKGQIKFKDYDSRMFARLFVEDPGARNALYKSFQPKYAREAANVKMKMVAQSLEFMSDEEIHQELTALFLMKCKKYKDVGKNFSAFIYQTFRYDAYRFVNGIQKPFEPYVHMQRELVHVVEELIQDRDMEIEVADSLFNQSPVMFIDDELGNSWVRGITCGDEFKDLTALQRMIVKLNYFDGMSDNAIANMMGMHINTIWRQRKKAAKLIETKVEELVKAGLY